MMLSHTHRHPVWFKKPKRFWVDLYQIIWTVMPIQVFTEQHPIVSVRIKPRLPRIGFISRIQWYGCESEFTTVAEVTVAFLACSPYQIQLAQIDLDHGSINKFRNMPFHDAIRCPRQHQCIDCRCKLWRSQTLYCHICVNGAPTCLECWYFCGFGFTGDTGHGGC